MTRFALCVIALGLLGAGRSDWATRMGMKLSAGPTITALTPAGYGRVIGLRVDDKIVSVNGAAVRGDADDFDALLNKLAARAPAPWVFAIERDGARLKLTHAESFDCNPFDLIGCGDLP
jgi:hypothetical protein